MHPETIKQLPKGEAVFVDRNRSAVQRIVSRSSQDAIDGLFRGSPARLCQFSHTFRTKISTY